MCSFIFLTCSFLKDLQINVMLKMNFFSVKYMYWTVLLTSGKQLGGYDL